MMKSFLRRQGEFGTALKRLRSLFASPLKVAQEIVHRERVPVVRKGSTTMRPGIKEGRLRRTRSDAERKTRKPFIDSDVDCGGEGRSQEGNKREVDKQSHVPRETTLKIKDENRRWTSKTSSLCPTLH